MILSVKEVKRPRKNHQCCFCGNYYFNFINRNGWIKFAAIVEGDFVYGYACHDCAVENNIIKGN